MLPVTEKLIKQLRKSTLPIEDRSALTALLLDKVSALPIENSIVIVPQGIQINGKMLDADQLVSFKESVIALNDNYARRIIHEQLRYLAITEGVHKGLTPEQIVFSKAALWTLEQEISLITKIAVFGTAFQA